MISSSAFNNYQYSKISGRAQLPKWCNFWRGFLPQALAGLLSYHNSAIYQGVYNLILRVVLPIPISGGVSNHNSALSGGISYHTSAISGGVSYHNSTISGRVSYHDSAISEVVFNLIWRGVFWKGFIPQLHTIQGGN